MRANRTEGYIEFQGSRPQLFDLGADPADEAARAELHERLFAWLRRMRVTLPDAEGERRTDTHKERGYRFGEW